jgi:putative methionine-R-sulfoxide reductase with GAF domain
MSYARSFDTQFFQKLLESAFAVQESGMNARPLARIVEIERAIKAGHLDVDETMRLIADGAHEVANADGVAVGQLKGDQLVYGAGSGSAASSVGRGIMATLIASATNMARAEILRVENAGTDPRIEAAICRQFGANSLIILPIYRGGAVAGVLQVLFNAAHSFEEQEVRIYRLLAALVGEAISQVARLERGTARIPELQTPQSAMELMPAPAKEPFDAQTRLLANDNAAVSDTYAPSIAATRKVLAIAPTAEIIVPEEHLKRIPVYGNAFRSALVVASVLALGSWVLYRERPSTMFSNPAQQHSPGSAEPTATFPPALPIPTNSVRDRDTSREVTRSAPVPAHGRRFPRRQSESEVRVRHFGDDVTVRYFNPKPAPLRLALRGTGVRRISDDVTVRYFTPQSVDEPRRPAGSDEPPPVSR